VSEPQREGEIPFPLLRVLFSVPSMLQYAQACAWDLKMEGHMSVIALEGIVKKGKILLTEDTTLPENTRVVIVVPEFTFETPITNKRQLLVAAEALATYYTTDEELTAFTVLDGEALHESE